MGLSETWPLSQKALYQVLVRGAVWDGLMDELRLTKQGFGSQG